MKLKVGDKLKVYKPFWVTILNKAGVCNRTTCFQFKQSAVVNDEIKVEKIDHEKDRVLFKVETFYADGTTAPNGTLFVEKISEFIPKYEKDKKDWKEERKKDDEILAWISSPD